MERDRDRERQIDEKWVFLALETWRCCLGRGRVYTGLGVGVGSTVKRDRLQSSVGGGVGRGGEWAEPGALRPGQAGMRRYLCLAGPAGIREHPGCGQTPREGTWHCRKPSIR